MPTGMWGTFSEPARPVIGRPKRDRRKQAAKRRQARRTR